MKQVAVVVLSWNALDLLEEYLPILLQYTSTKLADVIVADNGSEDGSVQWLETQGIWTLRLDQNYGFAEGYNRAIAQLEHEYILLLNNDVRVTDGWLEPLLAFMEEHPEVVSVQPKILWDQNPQSYEYAGAEGGYLDYLGYPFCRGRIFHKIEENRGQYGLEPKEVFWTSGAAMLVRREEFVAEGGFDTRFFAHQEEIDLCWRWHCAGHKLFVVPKSIVYHYGGASLSAENPHKTYLNFRNNILMLSKLLPDRRRGWTITARYFLDRLAAVVFLLQGKPRDFFAVFRAWWAYWRMPKSVRPEGRERAYHKLYRRLILIRFHIKREQTFNQLKK